MSKVVFLFIESNCTTCQEFQEEFNKLVPVSGINTVTYIYNKEAADLWGVTSYPSVVMAVSTITGTFNMYDWLGPTELAAGKLQVSFANFLAE